MKVINQYIFTLIITGLLIFVTSCTTNKQLNYNEHEDELIVEEIEEEKVEEINKYNTIESTLISLDKIGGRLIGTKGNHTFVYELKLYLQNNFPDADLFIQPYTINLTDEYNVTIDSNGDLVSFNNTNSLCKYLNKAKLNESVIVTDTLDTLDNSLNYIFISEDEGLIEASKEYENVCLSLMAVDEVYLGQNVIKVNTDIPTIMNISKGTAQELLNLKSNAELKIEINNKETELENVFVVIKGKSSDDAIVVTSHIDTTTAKGNNYSKGAIDNGSGISLNLDLLRKTYAEENSSNYDLIFAFVNSEEGFLLKSSSGSMQLINLLSQRYKNILNLNLDCLGEKNIDVLNYGFDGNVNGDIISEVIISQESGNFILEKAEYYTSDNLNFENNIYFYNFNYHGKDRAIHTEIDTINAANIDNLEYISTIIYNVLSKIKNINSEDLFL